MEESKGLVDIVVSNPSLIVFTGLVTASVASIVYLVLTREEGPTHMTPKQGKRYAGLLRYVESHGKSTDDLWFWNRWFADKMLEKRINCAECSEVFSRAYYGKPEYSPEGATGR